MFMCWRFCGQLPFLWISDWIIRMHTSMSFYVLWEEWIERLNFVYYVSVEGKIVLTQLLTVLSQVWLIRTRQVYFCHGVSFLSLASLSDWFERNQIKEKKKYSFRFTFSEAWFSHQAPELWLRWNRISCIWELKAEKKSGCWDPRQEWDMFFKGTCSYLLPSIRLCYFIAHGFSFLFNQVICTSYILIYTSLQDLGIYTKELKSYSNMKERMAY